MFVYRKRIKDEGIICKKLLIMNSEENILNLLKDKASTKQKVYKITKKIFSEIQDLLKKINA